MSYNTELQSNNNDLRTLLATVNNLPKAGGVELPELTNPASASDIAQGMEVIGANGKKITGDAYSIVADEVGVYNNFSEVFFVNDKIRVTGKMYHGTLFYENSYARVFAPTSEFGNATADQVMAGVTFTSEAGLKVTGTMTEPTTETWVFTMEDGSTVTKAVYVE